MGLERHTQEATRDDRSNQLRPKIPGKPHILIISYDDVICDKLNIVFRDAGLTAERARSMTEGCEAALSGRFQVIVTEPLLADGSWEQLTDIESHDRMGFVVILMATFDPDQTANALEEGAFEVLDVFQELPQAVDAARRASWAAYLMGAGPRLEPAHLLRIA